MFAYSRTFLYGVLQFDLDLYKECLAAHNYAPSRVWNMDETGVTTVQKPGKIVAPKGMRQVGKIRSGERGVWVTLICVCNAAGGFLPPIYIFRRKRMADVLMKDAPPQAVGYSSQNGWTDSELHFLNGFDTLSNSRVAPAMTLK